MGERWQRFAAEVGRFLAVGLLATIVALILFNLLVHGLDITDFAPLNEQPELAYVIANGVGMLISYQGTKTWAFRNRRSRHADGGFAAFVTINLLTMLIPITCLLLSRNLLGFDDPVSDNISANVVGLLLANVARFFLFGAWCSGVRHPRSPANAKAGRAGRGPSTGRCDRRLVCRHPRISGLRTRGRSRRARARQRARASTAG